MDDTMRDEPPAFDRPEYLKPPVNLPDEKYRQFGKEEQASLQRKIDSEKKKVFTRDAFVKQSPIGNPAGELLPSVSLYSNELNEDLPSARLYREPPPNSPEILLPPETLERTINQGLLARVRGRIGGAVRSLVNDLFNTNPATEIVPSSQVPPMTTTVAAPPLSDMPERLEPAQPAVEPVLGTLPPALEEELADDKLSLTEKARNLLKDSGVMALIGTVRTLKDNGNEYERILRREISPSENYARLVNFARQQFPLNDRTKTYELVFRFLSPGQRAGALEISLDEFAQMRERMLLLSEALIDSQFNGQMPTLIAECLSLYDAYSLESGQLLKRRDLFRIANQVLALNGEGDPWRGIDPQVRKHFKDIAANIALQSS